MESAFNSPEEYQAFAQDVIDAPGRLYKSLSDETKKMITLKEFEEILKAKIKRDGIKVPTYKKDASGKKIRDKVHVFRDYEAIVKSSRKGLTRTVQNLKKQNDQNLSKLSDAKDTISELENQLTERRKDIKRSFNELERIKTGSSTTLAQMQVEAEAAKKNDQQLTAKQAELLETVRKLTEQRDKLLSDKLVASDKLRSYATELGEQSEEVELMKRTFAEIEGALERTEEKAKDLQVRLNAKESELSKSQAGQQSYKFMRAISKRFVGNDTRLSRLVSMDINVDEMRKIAVENNIDMAVAGPIISALKAHGVQMKRRVGEKAAEIKRTNDRGSNEKNWAAALDELKEDLSKNLKKNLEEAGAATPTK